MDSNQPQNQAQDQQDNSTPKQSAVARIQQATNVLVTVKSDPNVDELAATIGLTIMLNKLGKHATAVFSGAVPNTLEFLKPEETLETNTDSLRDFIVSLDKSKADKLRYKVEENVVKIFITPYRTSITQDDLEFTQGDFNVDVVLALGVTKREELDQAIMAHGRILHDATVITITAGSDYSELGQINWQEQGASSLSEMLVSISEAFQGGLIDEQIATAFLTGIVSETERFSNPKTSPKVMTMAAQLMAAGANQQLIANELEKAVEVQVAPPVQDVPTETGPAPEVSVSEDGSLTIAHNDTADQPAEEKPAELPEPAPEAEENEPLLPPSQQSTERFLPPAPEPGAGAESFNPLMPEAPAPEQPDLPTAPDVSAILGSSDGSGSDSSHGDIHIDTDGNLLRKTAAEPKHRVIQPLPDEPQTQSPTSEQAPDGDDPGTKNAPSLANGFKLPPPPPLDLTPSEPIKDDTTLTEIEQAVHSPHLQEPPETAEAPGGLDSARDAVMSALDQTGFDPAGQARADLNALPLGAPPEPTPFDSFRLSGAPPEQGPPVNDVSGSLPPELQPQPDNNQMPPPPVPPPMTAL